MRDGWVWGLVAVPMGGGRTRAGRTQTTSPDRWEAAARPAGPGRGAGGRRRGQAAAPVGGGGAWPGFETTRRAKLAARTASGRAAAHGCIKQPGPANTTKPPGPTGDRAAHASGR